MSGTTMVGKPVSDGFRSDIEGLRAIAVGAVLLFHAGFGFAGGGYVGVADTTRPRVDVPECLASVERVAACSVARDETHTHILQYDVAEALEFRADMADFVCTPTVCPAEIENVIVWRDTGHLTATYSQSLAAALKQVLPDV